MTDEAFDVLNTDAVYDQIVAGWKRGQDTMDIALQVEKGLRDAGHLSVPTLNEVQACAHNVIAFHRDTVRVARQREACRA